jgi:hypothetical protein
LAVTTETVLGVATPATVDGDVAEAAGEDEPLPHADRAEAQASAISRY